MSYTAIVNQDLPVEVACQGNPMCINKPAGDTYFYVRKIL